MDASRGWTLYWTLQALDLLDARPEPDVLSRVVHALTRFQWRGCSAGAAAGGMSAPGGFGGGVLQTPHALSTYADVLSLLIVGTEEAYAAIDRPALHAFYLRCKNRAVGGFCVHPGGELDVRGTYAIIAICDLLHMLTPGIVEGTADFILSCQTYEGGFAGEPGNEAHGGYTFCAIAALEALGQLQRARLPELARWLTHRQLQLEGGLSGRANKLVDGCYSFWQGACFAILSRHMPGTATGYADTDSSSVRDVSAASPDSAAAAAGATAASAASPAAPSPLHATAPVPDYLLDRRKLQRYILFCCQCPDGGLRDKPSKPRDHYHTCYTLSGLSIAQHDAAGRSPDAWIEGDPAVNRVAATHPVYNIRYDRVAAARAHFGVLPPPQDVDAPVPSR
jgi:protein farnesyltransferase subunit beta